MKLFVIVIRLMSALDGWNAACDKCKNLDTLSDRGILTMGPARRIAENPFLIVIGQRL